MRQNIYLSNISLNEAIDIFLEKIKDFKLGREYVKLMEQMVELQQNLYLLKFHHLLQLFCC